MWSGCTRPGEPHCLHCFIHLGNKRRASDPAANMPHESSESCICFNGIAGGKGLPEVWLRGYILRIELDSPVSCLASLLSLAHICLGFDTSWLILSRKEIPARIHITSGLAYNLSHDGKVFQFKNAGFCRLAIFFLKVVCVSWLELTSGNSCAHSALLWHVEARYGCLAGWLAVCLSERELWQCHDVG